VWLLTNLVMCANYDLEATELGGHYQVFDLGIYLVLVLA
jgi:hypothetical protein